MLYGEFLKKVQDQTGMDREAADRLARATVATLVECAGEKEVWDWPAQFPKELQLPSEVKDLISGPYLERYSPMEFYHRVSSRAEIHYSQAELGARIVAGLLKEAASPDFLERMERNLSPDLRDQLFRQKAV
jgi:uncharacterized protein (DUF2267 family)